MLVIALLSPFILITVSVFLWFFGYKKTSGALLLFLLISVMSIFIFRVDIEDFLTDLAYPEFSEKNTYRKVMEQQDCFDAGGIWWLSGTQECGFKKEGKE